MKFDDMNAMQRRLHNAAHVLDAEGDENGFVCMLRQAVEEVEALKKDAARYRWLRKQHWSESAIAVVADPKQNTRFGAYCPSEYLLDDAIDTIMDVGALKEKT